MAKVELPKLVEDKSIFVPILTLFEIISSLIKVGSKLIRLFTVPIPPTLPS